MPSGPRSGERVMLFLTKYQWITLHDYVGFVMASLVILHIYFNFRPLKTFVKILSGSKE